MIHISETLIQGRPVIQSYGGIVRELELSGDVLAICVL